MSRCSVLIACIAVGVFAGCKRPPPPAPRPATKPATTQAAGIVTASPKKEELPPATVLDVVRRDLADYPTKRPLDVPGDLADAAKIVLDRPARVDAQGNLWLVHPAGISLAEAKRQPIRDHTVVTRDAIDFITPPSVPKPATRPDAGWPEKPVEVIPLADESVMVIAENPADGNAFLKLFAGPEKPVTGEQLRAVQPLARKLADRDPTVRQTAQRELEAMGPSVLPVLEMMRDQLPPEAQIRIESMLGQRFAPTIAGLRLSPGRVRTLARFAGGGCVLRFDGGGTIDADGDEPARSVIPATVLIRPGWPLELIDPESVCDFVPGRQSIQWIGDELLVSDPTVGPRRWIGTSLSKPILQKDLADFDKVIAIDARRRWLLTSAKRPGKTLLIDPSLPDTTPKLPTWTIAGDAVGQTDAGWPAIKRGDRLFVLEKNGWRIDKAEALHPLPLPLAIAADKHGRVFCIDGNTIHGTHVGGQDVTASITGDATDATPLAFWGLLLVYTPDGTVRRFKIGTERLAIEEEASFTQGVPRQANAWIDSGRRLVLSNDKTMTIAFPEGRIPRELSDLMLNSGR